jgi:hypothetical protein
MRANGVPDFPDPKPGGGFGAVRFPASGPSPAFKAAQAKCGKLVPGFVGPPGPGTQTHPSPHALAQMVRVAQCMRRHGIYDFPDPRTSVPSHLSPGPGVISDIDGVILVFPGTIDEQSRAFTRAAAACAFPLHNH